MRRGIGKYEVIQVDNPNGSGHSYYGVSYPEGLVLAANFGDFPVDVYAAIVAWELEKAPVVPMKPNDPKPIFNRQGWVN